MTKPDSSLDKGKPNFQSIDGTPITGEVASDRDETIFSNKTKVVKRDIAPDKTRVLKPQEKPSDCENDKASSALDAEKTTFKNYPEKDVPSSSNNLGNTDNDATKFRPPRQGQEKNAGDDSLLKTELKHASSTPTVQPKTDISTGKNTKILKDRFLLQDILGIGGMGVVYKAKDRLKVEAQDRDPYVAIKVLSEEFKSHPEAFIALQRESRKAQRIAHPNTVKVYDFDRDGDVVFMTMEYMQGRPLDQVIKQYKATGLPRDDVWNILSGMCSALAHAHSENIVHSDFKPGNVFVTDNGMAKIFDFGIARAVATIDRHTGKEQDQTVFDAGGLGALTPAYASLEMLLGKTPDTRDDVYALGCVAYELFSGEHPFNRLPADEAYNKNLKPKRITDITKRQWKAIESALSFKRETRIDSVDEFYKQLTVKKKSKLVVVIAFLLISGISYYSYVQVNVAQSPLVSDIDVRNKLEFNIRYDLFKENIDKLLSNSSFTKEWEENIWGEFQGMLKILSGNPDEWYSSARNKAYLLYKQKIKKLMKVSNLERA